jgi:hypothetical protein
MIVKITHSKSANKIYITSKPSHRGQDKQHAINFEEEPNIELIKKMQGKETAFFHAHLKEDSLVIDDMIEDQRW